MLEFRVKVKVMDKASVRVGRRVKAMQVLVRACVRACARGRERGREGKHVLLLPLPLVHCVLASCWILYVPLAQISHFAEYGLPSVAGTNFLPTSHTVTVDNITYTRYL